MLGVVNNLLARVWALVRDFFRPKFEFGVLEVNCGEQTISVVARGPVQKVWFQTEPRGVPVCGGAGHCFISEPTITREGFTFAVRVHTASCVVRWFAIL